MKSRYSLIVTVILLSLFLSSCSKDEDGWSIKFPGFKEDTTEMVESEEERRKRVGIDMDTSNLNARSEERVSDLGLKSEEGLADNTPYDKLPPIKDGMLDVSKTEIINPKEGEYIISDETDMLANRSFKDGVTYYIPPMDETVEDVKEKSEHEKRREKYLNEMDEILKEKEKVEKELDNNIIKNSSLTELGDRMEKVTEELYSVSNDLSVISDKSIRELAGVKEEGNLTNEEMDRVLRKEEEINVMRKRQNELRKEYETIKEERDKYYED